MDRKALLIYLKNLRDLEVAKWQLNRFYEHAQYEYCSNDRYYKTVNYKDKMNIWDEDVWIRFIGSIVCLLISIMSWKLSIKLSSLSLYSILVVFGIVVGILAVIISIVTLCCIVSLFKELSYNKRLNKEREKHNKQEAERTKNFHDLRQQNQAQWNEEKAFIQSEYSKVNDLLNKSYSINILPNQYRNLAAVYYIYDYMSSSQATLEDTLIHEHMENGIQRIIDKLDKVISQNEEIILQNRVIESNTREISGSNIKILESCRRNEFNTQQAAQYAEIAADYAEANAWFSFANYLKD